LNKQRHKEGLLNGEPERKYGQYGGEFLFKLYKRKYKRKEKEWCQGIEKKLGKRKRTKFSEDRQT